MAKIRVKLKFETKTEMEIEAKDIHEAEIILNERIANNYYPHPMIKGAEFKLLGDERK